ncbi:hypothetical protein OTF26_27075, partial [Klebsiella pneumoniae]|nr:hypothetical protein [Klebsiella pneumoniae]
MKNFIAFSLLAATLVLSGCATTGSASPTEKRNLVQNMRADTLSKLYKEKPDVKQQIANSAGYAVF